jgi:hypothetical protein
LVHDRRLDDSNAVVSTRDIRLTVSGTELSRADRCRRRRESIAAATPRPRLKFRKHANLLQLARGIELMQ